MTHSTITQQPGDATMAKQPDDSTKLAEAFALLALLEDHKLDPTLATKQAQNAFSFASQLLGRLHEGDEDPWSGKEIDTVVRKSSRFIVYLDDELRVRWWWVIKPHIPTLVTVQARINELTHDSAFLLLDWPGKSWLRRGRECDCLDGDLHKTPEARTIRSLIGEAMAVVLGGGTLEDCEKVLVKAEHAIAVAKDQRCRPRFVGWFAAAVAGISIVAFLLYRWTDWFTGNPSPNDSATWVNAAIAGAFGALVSAVSRTKDLKLEPAARNPGLAVEACARALIGAAAGLLVNFAFEGGLLVKDALANDETLRNAIRLFLCLAGGTSERVLPALVGRAEGMVTQNDSNSTGTSSGDAKKRAKDEPAMADPPTPVG
jgi:hypothetical protein